MPTCLCAEVLKANCAKQMTEGKKDLLSEDQYKLTGQGWIAEPVAEVEPSSQSHQADQFTSSQENTVGTSPNSSPDCTAECSPDRTAECTPECTAECTIHKSPEAVQSSAEPEHGVTEESITTVDAAEGNVGPDGGGSPTAGQQLEPPGTAEQQLGMLIETAVVAVKTWDLKVNPAFFIITKFSNQRTVLGTLNIDF